MTTGELWWVEEPTIGRRPACVLTRAEGIPALNAVVVAFVTRTTRGIPSEVPLDERDGMPMASVLTLDNLQTVPKSLLTERITQLSPARMGDVCRALAAATGC